MPETKTEQTEAKVPTDTSPIEDFMDHERRAVEELGKALEALLPAGFREHGSEASREFAKGIKVLVDAAIGELEKVSKKVEAEAEKVPVSSTGKTKVKVQVE